MIIVDETLSQEWKLSNTIEPFRSAFLCLDGTVPICTVQYMVPAKREAWPEHGKTLENRSVVHAFPPIVA